MISFVFCYNFLLGFVGSMKFNEDTMWGETDRLGGNKLDIVEGERWYIFVY